MGEYQSHEWQTVDRLLTPEEVSAVNQLSSHIEVSSSKAVVTYHWSSFSHDPREVLLQYFDAYFYFAEWGGYRLMFRFPAGLLEKDAVLPYCMEEGVTYDTYGKYDVLDIELSPDDGGDWVDEALGVDLSDFVSLRSQLLEGDYRLLYLAWLAAQTYYGDVDDDDYEAVVEEEEEEEEFDAEYDLEPPVPPGLKKLSPALKQFAQVFGVDPFLIQAAAEASPDLQQPLAVDTRQLVARLPRAECDDFLARLVEGDSGVRLALRKRLGDFLPAKEKLQSQKPRSLQQLLIRAGQLEQAENERQAEQARRKHIEEMKAFAKKEPQAWQQVDDLLARGRKIASVYDEATAILEKLQALAEFQGKSSSFRSRMRDLAGAYATRPALLERWKNRGWV